MKTQNYNLQKVKLIFLTLFTLIIVTLTSCRSTELKVAEYDFVYQGNSYVIRSTYCPDNPRSCNKLIGNDFVAVDMNQDRIMDKITKGNISLLEAQEIYDYSLDMLEKAGKLNEIDKTSKQFELKDSEYTFYIKSFGIENEEPFNEFTVVDKKAGLNQYKTSIFIDHGANGKLNEVLKGGILLEDAQKMYTSTIDTGLSRLSLTLEDGVLRVK